MLCCFSAPTTPVKAYLQQLVSWTGSTRSSKAMPPRRSILPPHAPRRLNMPSPSTSAESSIAPLPSPSPAPLSASTVTPNTPSSVNPETSTQGTPVSSKMHTIEKQVLCEAEGAFTASSDKVMIMHKLLSQSISLKHWSSVLVWQKSRERPKGCPCVCLC